MAGVVIFDNPAYGAVKYNADGALGDNIRNRRGDEARKANSMRKAYRYTYRLMAMKAA